MPTKGWSTNDHINPIAASANLANSSSIGSAAYSYFTDTDDSFSEKGVIHLPNIQAERSRRRKDRKSGIDTRFMIWRGWYIFHLICKHEQWNGCPDKKWFDLMDTFP